MKRSVLIDILKRVEPALATRDFVPVFSCFCFDGKTVTAYDDVVAMTMPCPLSLKGAIKGSMLTGFLSASRIADIEVTQEEYEAKIKAGRSKLTASLLPEDDFIFAWPEEKSIDLSVPADFIKALEGCLVSMGSDPSRPSMIGVTLNFKEDRLTMYATDNKSASRMTVKMELPKEAQGKALIMSPRFCELLVGNSGKDKVVKLQFNEDWTLATFKSGLKLFSRCVGDVAIEDYQTLFESILTKPNIKAMITLPKGLDRALERAMVIAKPGEDTTKLTIKADKLRLETSTAVGLIRDVVPMKGHQECSVEVLPDVLSRAVAKAKEMMILTGTCIIFRVEYGYHVIAVVGERSEEEPTKKK